LPDEVIEQIIPEIDFHRDLVSFACASQSCRQFVTPQHIEYRLLRLGTARSTHVWAHLARRTDLACNIREIEIEQVFTSHPCIPTSFIEDVDLEKRSGEVQEAEIIRALEHMPRLKSFKW
ncbi:hypothetical protein BDN72DRAFT_743603, partial [Pluteus cervinus]